MITSRVLRHVFVPAAALVAEKAKPASGDCVCKPSELPIYTNEVQTTPNQEPCQREPGTIEQAFGSVRRSIFAMFAELKQIEAIGQDYVNVGIDHAQGVIEYLQEEDNTTPKYGAVALGGLAGFILGLRGGLFKRTIYTSAGALGMAAICYPKEAAEYSKIGVAEAKHYAVIAYNFMYGVKKDDPPLALPSLPSVPGSLSEAWDAAKNLGKSAISTVTDKEKEPEKEKVMILATESQIVDPLCVVSEVHDAATNKSCHCPIGACMGHHEEGASNDSLAVCSNPPATETS